MKRTKNTAICALSVSACVAVYVIFTYFHGCVWKKLLGIPCLGCGYTRALVSLLKLDFSKAFYFHPLVFLFPLFFILIFYQGKVFKNRRENTLFWGYVALLFFAVWIIRFLTNSTV